MKLIPKCSVMICMVLSGCGNSNNTDPMDHFQAVDAHNSVHDHNDGGGGDKNRDVDSHQQHPSHHSSQRPSLKSKSQKHISKDPSEKQKNFEQNLIEFWTSHLKSKDSRIQWFERMISMYDQPGRPRGQYFSSRYPSMYNFLRDTFGDDADYDRIVSESRLIYPSTRSSDEVVHSLVWRVPGYAGGLVQGWYDADKFATVYENVGQEGFDMRAQAQTLITASDPPSSPGVSPMIRYSLLPRIDRSYAYGILSATKTYRTEPPPSSTHWIHVLHIWGVNFESQNTQDWQKLVVPNIQNGVLNVPHMVQAYKRRMEEMFAIIKQSIIETANILAERHPEIRVLNAWIPGVGLNNFLRALGSYGAAAHDGCVLAFFKVMNDNLFSKTDGEILATASETVKQRVAAGTLTLSLRFVGYTGLPSVALRHASELPAIVTTTANTGPRSFIHGALFGYDEHQPNGYFLLVNAWDPMTFIGNGGSRDPSMDGWFGGGYSSGQFACTAWLSNLHMIPSLINNMVKADLP